MRDDRYHVLEAAPQATCLISSLLQVFTFLSSNLQRAFLIRYCRRQNPPGQCDSLLIPPYPGKTFAALVCTSEIFGITIPVVV